VCVWIYRSIDDPYAMPSVIVVPPLANAVVAARIDTNA